MNRLCSSRFALGVFEEQSPVSRGRRGFLCERRRPQGGRPTRVRLEHERQLPLPATLPGKPEEYGEECQGPGDQVRPSLLNTPKEIHTASYGCCNHLPGKSALRQTMQFDHVLLFCFGGSDGSACSPGRRPNPKWSKRRWVLLRLRPPHAVIPPPLPAVPLYLIVCTTLLR